MRMAMREQNNGIVVLDGSLQRLPILTAWVKSSAVWWFRPSYPALGMSVKVGNAGANGWVADVKMTCHPERGMWRAYVHGSRFSERCETRYKVESVDELGARHVEGEGILRVYDGAIPDAEDGTELCIAAFPDGTVREVTVAEDETGTPSFVIGNPVEGSNWDSKPIYAFNNATGYFHLVTAFIDEAGEPMLSVAEEPSSGGYESYARDASGFYRRVECARDESGATMLQTGKVVQ